jgi:hypothetical protein
MVMRGLLREECLLIVVVNLICNILLLMSEVISKWSFLSLYEATIIISHSVITTIALHTIHSNFMQYSNLISRKVVKLRKPLKIMLSLMIIWCLKRYYIVRVIAVSFVSWRGIVVLQSSVQRRRVVIVSASTQKGIKEADLIDDKDIKKNTIFWLTSAVKTIGQNMRKFTPTFSSGKSNINKATEGSTNGDGATPDTPGLYSFQRYQ